MSKSYYEFREKLLEEDPELRAEYEALQPEFAASCALMEARIAQDLTQQELAKKTGVSQADISRIENGTRNPSVKLLQRIADGLGMELQIRFVPKRAGNFHE